MDTLEAIQTRRSIRQYQEQAGAGGTDRPAPGGRHERASTRGTASLGR